jgi:hypothetical protein
MKYPTSPTLHIKWISSIAIAAILATACTPDSDADGYDAVDDCDDLNPAVYPGAPEICDGLDNNCDGRVDEPSEDGNPYYFDADRDGYGNAESIGYGCDVPYGHVHNDLDCNDEDPRIHPDADEVCDEQDNNCDGTTDEDTALDALEWYQDTDGDGYGIIDVVTYACAQPDGYAGLDNDCDDTLDTINPGADETCNEADDDCDGEVDEFAVDGTTYYADSDADDYGDPDGDIVLCTATDGYVTDNTDCDDSTDTVNPGAFEICDGLDNDCDETTSEDGLVTDDSGTNHSSIQEALDSASENGLVNVCAGSFSEDLFIEKSLTLQGVAGDGDTFIVGSGGSAVINVWEPADVTIRGLHISEGSSYTGGGINGFAATSLTVEDCTVQNNVAEYGGGIMGAGTPGATIIRNTIIRENEGESSAGGLYMFGGTIEDSRIEDNSSNYAGGIFQEEADLVMTNTLLVSNFAEIAGGGLLAYNTNLLDGGTYKNNVADLVGGGLYIISTTLSQNLTIQDNVAGQLGGGLLVEGDLEVTDSTFSGNQANEQGGGAYVFAETMVFRRVTFADNESASGAALYWEQGDVLLSVCTVEANIESGDGGAAVLGEGAYLESVNTDWGTSTRDNSPNDIHFDEEDGLSYNYASASSFECDTATGTCY